MAKIYADLIMKGKKTFEEVPDNLKDEVRRILDESGYEIPDTNG